jgi:hypothetical protein
MCVVAYVCVCMCRVRVRIRAGFCVCVHAWVIVVKSNVECTCAARLNTFAHCPNAGTVVQRGTLGPAHSGRVPQLKSSGKIGTHTHTYTKELHDAHTPVNCAAVTASSCGGCGSWGAGWMGGGSSFGMSGWRQLGHVR